MASLAVGNKKIPVVPVAIAAVALAVLIALIVYLSRPSPQRAQESPSPEARAYLPHLQLNDVSMKATENFMKQQVVEINGTITNSGSRSLRRVDVYCIFDDVDGRPVYRERSSIVESTKGGALEPGRTRPFRMPFDSLPDSWNQAMPHLVIARIIFAK